MKIRTTMTTISELRSMLGRWEKKHLDRKALEHLEVHIASHKAGGTGFFLEICGADYEQQLYYAKNEDQLADMLSKPLAEWPTETP